MVKRFGTSVAPNGPAATVLELNGLVISLSCPGGAVTLHANDASGEAAQLRFEGVGISGALRPARRRARPDEFAPSVRPAIGG